MSVEDDLQHALRIGDTVLFYAKAAQGYVFSELSRYVVATAIIIIINVS